MALRPWLKLARITNLPTVIADVLGGCLIAAGPLWLAMLDPVRSAASEGLSQRDAMQALGGWVPVWVALLLLTAAACLLYLSGMIDNDVRHAAKDSLLRKPRPIVEGEVALGHAAFARNLLALLGILLAGLAAAAVHIEMRWIATAGLVFCLGIVAGSRLYNRLAGGRAIEFTWHPPTRSESRTGLFLLAGCRMCSMGLGVVLGAAVAAHASRSSVPDHLLGIDVLAALTTSGAFFFLVTRLSLMEDFGGKPEAIRRMGTLLTTTMWAGPIVIYVHHYDGFSDPRYLIECLPALALLLIASVTVWIRIAIAARAPTPPNVGKVIGTSITCWPLLVAAMVLLSGTEDAHDGNGEVRLAAGLAIAAMTPVSLFLRRFGSGT